MATKRKVIAKSVTTSITLEEEDVAEILRAHFNAPSDARVDFDCYSVARVVVSWTTTEYEDGGE